jgi:hypothetical protein
MGHSLRFYPGADRRRARCLREQAGEGAKGRAIGADQDGKAKRETPIAYPSLEIGTLDKKTVVVRRKVVKVSRESGKNWIHLRDGSGATRRQQVFTSQDVPKVGDVLTARHPQG